MKNSNIFEPMGKKDWNAFGAVFQGMIFILDCVGVYYAASVGSLLGSFVFVLGAIASFHFFRKFYEQI